MAAEVIDLSDLKKLIRDLRVLDKTAGRRVARAMKVASQFVADDAKRRAAWSTRIPATVKVSSTQKAIKLRAGGAKAPHADVYEFGGRHPLFGDRSRWYPVDARKYMADARDANIDKLANDLLKAVADAIRTGG